MDYLLRIGKLLKTRIWHIRIMKLKNKIVTAKSDFFLNVKSLLKPLFEKAGMKMRLQSRLRLLNIKATENPKKYMTRFLAAFVMIFAINILMLFYSSNSQDDRDGIMVVDPVLKGFSQIQSQKEFHQNKINGILDNSIVLKHQLDSLIAIPEKTHEDSLQIVRKHRQIQIVVNNLIPKTDEKN